MKDCDGKTPHDLHTYSDGQHTWAVPDLWRAVLGQPAEPVPLPDLDVEGLLDSYLWSDESKPLTVREILMHAQRVEDADLSYPVILTPDGHVADGVHRTIKAHRLGHSTVQAVRLPAMPPPLASEG